MERTEGWIANYDDLAELLRVKAQAKAVLVVVLDGSRGSGTAVRVEGRAITTEQQNALMWDMMEHACVHVGVR